MLCVTTLTCRWTLTTLTEPCLSKSLVVFLQAKPQMNSTGKIIKYKSTAGQSAQHISSYLLFLLSVNCLLHQLIWFVVLQKAILFHLMQLQKKITSRGRLDKESVVGIQFIAAEPFFFFFLLKHIRTVLILISTAKYVNILLQDIVKGFLSMTNLFNLFLSAPYFYPGRNVLSMHSDSSSFLI